MQKMTRDFLRGATQALVALDGEGANSPFSAALSRHIGTLGLEAQQMLTRVRAEVFAATRNKQLPWSNSSLPREAYLAAK